MTPQIALAMLILINLALLVLYIHMEWEIKKLKEDITNYPIFLNGARLRDGFISYDGRNHTYMIHGVVLKEDLRGDRK